MKSRMSYFKSYFLTLFSGLCISGSKGNLALNGVALQSSLGNPQGDAKHAVDGNTDSDFKKNSCTMTAAEFNPWWRVDLGDIYSVHNVTITNRGDCCRERIRGAQIRVGNSLDNNGNNNVLVATILTAFIGTETFAFVPVNGRYVNIVRPGKNEILTLCEVEVLAVDTPPSTCSPRNLALDGKAVQSTTYESYQAENAVDGNRNPVFSLGSCSATNGDKDPWWRVDLLNAFKINRVSITNREDNAERINGVQIRIGNILENNGNNNPRAATVDTIPAGATKTFVFNPLFGRYVNIFIPGRNEFLTLCEVEVFAVDAPPYTCAPRNLALAGKAVQSTTYESYQAQKAVDGIRNPVFALGSCSVTNGDKDPWWRVDLLNAFNITGVSITNRGGCCAERINGVQIRIGNSLEKNGNNNTLAATVETIPAGETKTFEFNPLYGRYVNLFIPGRNEFLTLCEVEVFAVDARPYICVLRNLALDGKAVQSTTFQSYQAQNAVDGNRNPVFSLGSCSATNGDKDPWWRVNLLNDYKITRVSITNRGDCCAERINGVQIRIGNSLKNNGNNNALAATVDTIPAGATKTFAFKPLDGRYVNIFIPGRSEFLTLCEVEVFVVDGPPYTCAPRNLALGGKAVQSTTFESSDAQNAVDGNRNPVFSLGSCSSTNGDKDPWWRVDLWFVFKITRVSITNRRDNVERINGVQIRIGNSLENNGNNNALAATVDSIPAGETKTFVFNPLYGRYVNIFIPGRNEFLTLCEVEVFAD